MQLNNNISKQIWGDKQNHLDCGMILAGCEEQPTLAGSGGL